MSLCKFSIYSIYTHFNAKDKIKFSRPIIKMYMFEQMSATHLSSRGANRLERVKLILLSVPARHPVAMYLHRNVNARV